MYSIFCLKYFVEFLYSFKITVKNAKSAKTFSKKNWYNFVEKTIENHYTYTLEKNVMKFVLLYFKIVIGNRALKIVNIWKKISNAVKQVSNFNKIQFLFLLYKHIK